MPVLVLLSFPLSEARWDSVRAVILALAPGGHAVLDIPAGHMYACTESNRVRHAVEAEIWITVPGAGAADLQQYSSVD